MYRKCEIGDLQIGQSALGSGRVEDVASEGIYLVVELGDESVHCGGGDGRRMGWEMGGRVQRWSSERLLFTFRFHRRRVEIAHARGRRSKDETERQGTNLLAFSACRFDLANNGR